MPNPKPWLSRRAAVLAFVLAAMLLPGLATAGYTFSVRGGGWEIADGPVAGQAAPAVAPPVLVAPMADRSTVQSEINDLTATWPITFAPNATALTPTGATTVARIAEMLRSTPTLRIEVDGHVARTPGRDPDPQVLSDDRAVAVRAQLVRLGVAADRITAVGLSDTKPVARNTTAQGRAANRRAEIVVR